MAGNTGETNEVALVPSERSLEVRVGDKAVEKLRTDLELKHPELEALFFVPQDFAVFYGVKATLEEINDSVTKEKYEAFLTERLVQYLNKSAELRQRKGLFAKLRGEDKHLYVDKTKLTDRALGNLSEQAYKDVFSEQLKRVGEIRSTFDFRQYSDGKSWHFTTHIQEKLEGLIKETTSFIRNFSIVPVNESTERTAWESIIPVDEITKVLGGLLYESKRVKPFEASGKIFSQSHSENAMPQYTLLEPQYGVVLSDKLFMPFEDFNKDLKQLIDRLVPFVKKEAQLPPDLQVNLALLNYFVNGLYNENGNLLSASYVTGINMALRGINKHLEDVFSSIRGFELKDIMYYPSHIRDLIQPNTNFELIELKRYEKYAARKPVN